MPAQNNLNPQIAQIAQMNNKNTKRENVRDPRTYAIIGAAMEVHRELGCGFLEAVYQEALGVEFEQRGIPFAREVELPIRYKDRRLDVSYRADFVCYGQTIVEVKALSAVGGTECSQVINYLKATGLEVGLLLNFGSASLEYKRLVLSSFAKSAQSAD